MKLGGDGFGNGIYYLHIFSFGFGFVVVACRRGYGG